MLQIVAFAVDEIDVLFAGFVLAAFLIKELVGDRLLLVGEADGEQGALDRKNEEADDDVFDRPEEIAVESLGEAPIAEDGLENEGRDNEDGEEDKIENRVAPLGSEDGVIDVF